jgi:hypothetical protein
MVSGLHSNFEFRAQLSSTIGPGSFFKPHKDTPRGKRMFGSLVVILPTSFTGGKLLLRHGGKEIAHDCGASFEFPSHSVAWIAFYSDVEHEVSVVEDGYRVTLTYNLYFVDNGIPIELPQQPDVTTTTLFDAFSSALADPKFLPDGGTLGFGLYYEYSNAYLGGLKGCDATLRAVGRRLGLNPKLKYVYEDIGYLDGAYLCDSTLSDFNDEVEDEELRQELRDAGGVIIESSKADTIELEVHWIVPKNDWNAEKSTYVHYGNEARLMQAYGACNMIMTVGDSVSRGLSSSSSSAPA